MKAGSLRNRITLMKPTVADDGHGQQVPTFQDVATVFCSDQPLSMRGIAAVRDGIVAGTEANVSYRWVAIRYRGDVRNDWRVRFVGGRRDGMVGEIMDAREDNKRDELALVVKLVNP